MDKDITTYAKTRHTAKAYDSGKKISASDVEKIKELLRFSPSSVNGQPWHFIVASTDAGKDRIAKSGADTLYPFNAPLIRDASHVVIFCHKTNMEEDYLLKILACEEKDGRFDADPSFKDKMHGGRTMFVNLHKDDFKDVPSWTAKKAYLNLGAFLLGVATLGIDATPMEGIDTDALDAEFGLKDKGYASAVVVTLGYHDKGQDYNASLPKSRLPYDDILTEI